MENNVKSTYKSDDTEEWLDKVWTRPIGYLWARFFNFFGIHPNVVTVLSMIIGACSALFFYHGSFVYEGTKGLIMNIIGVLLLSWANFYDSADGQLARMTGKKTRLGRILDGAAGDVWFIPIYIVLVLRFYNHHSVFFSWFGIADTQTNSIVATLVFLLVAAYSGFVCHSSQCAKADYYRQVHLFFLKGEKGSELDSYSQQKQLYDSVSWRGNFIWKVFLWFYVNYTRKQEKRTPVFQKLYAALREKYSSSDNIPQEFRDAFREKSLPLMKYTNILTFNTRAIALYLCTMLDITWMYFVFEIVIMGILCKYMQRTHEHFCQQFLNGLQEK